MVLTRSKTMDEAMKYFMSEVIAAAISNVHHSINDLKSDVNQSIEALNQSVNGVCVQQNFVAKELQKVVNESLSSTPKNNFTRISRFSKVEFPKFYGVDVKGWVYRCQQFFAIEDMDEQKKVKLASIAGVDVKGCG